MDVLDKSYKDQKAVWDGSLVTGEVNPDFKGNKEAPIKLPDVTKEDYLTCNQKVLYQPKNLEAMAVFPGDRFEKNYLYLDLK
jgi:hypothetical protein